MRGGTDCILQVYQLTDMDGIAVKLTYTHAWPKPKGQGAECVWCLLVLSAPSLWHEALGLRKDMRQSTSHKVSSNHQ